MASLSIIDSSLQDWEPELRRQAGRLVELLLGLLLLASLFLLFLASSTYFSNFNGDWPYYASEGLCSVSTRLAICGESGEWPTDPFQQGVGTVDRIPDLNVRFVSESFARLYEVFLNSTDTFASALAKIHMFKSFVAAFLISASLYLTRCFPASRPFAVKAALCAFAFPYLLFTTASVYPAPIASVALLLTLICMKVMTEVGAIKISQHVLLATLFTISSLVVLANRFETTMFCGLAVLLVALRNWGSRSMRKRLAFCLATYGILFGIFAVQNTAMNNLFLESVQLKLRVVSVAAADTSAAIRHFGDIGFSLLAPVTLIDNSTRNLSAATTFSESSFDFWAYPLIAVSWIPLSIVMMRHLAELTQLLVQTRKRGFPVLVQTWPSLVCIALFILIPSIFKSIWFFQYAVPLMMVTLFFNGRDRLSDKSVKILMILGVCSNSLTFLNLAQTRNLTAVGNLLIKTHWLIFAVLIAGVTTTVASNGVNNKLIH